VSEAGQPCPSCGTPRAAGGRFCTGCARDLDAPQESGGSSYKERYRGTAFDTSTPTAPVASGGGSRPVILLVVALLVVAVVGAGVVVASGMLDRGSEVASAPIVPSVPHVPSPSPDPTLHPGGVCAREGVGDVAWPPDWKMLFCDAVEKFYEARKSEQKLMRAAESGQADVAIASAASALALLDDANRAAEKVPSWWDGRGMLDDLRTVIRGYREAIEKLRYTGFTRSTAAIAKAKQQIYTADKTLLRMRESLGGWVSRDRPYARYLAFKDHVTPALKESQSLWAGLADSHDLLDEENANRFALGLGNWVLAQEEWLLANPEHACYDAVAEEFKEYQSWAVTAAVLARWHMNVGISDEDFGQLLAARDEMATRQKAILEHLKTTPDCPGASADPASAKPSASPAASTKP
jgi:hypothetical protein